MKTLCQNNQFLLPVAHVCHRLCHHVTFPTHRQHLLDAWWLTNLNNQNLDCPLVAGIYPTYFLHYEHTGSTGRMFLLAGRKRKKWVNRTFYIYLYSGIPISRSGQVRHQHLRLVHRPHGPLQAGQLHPRYCQVIQGVGPSIYCIGELTVCVSVLKAYLAIDVRSCWSNYCGCVALRNVSPSPDYPAYS